MGKPGASGRVTGLHLYLLADIGDIDSEE